MSRGVKRAKKKPFRYRVPVGVLAPGARFNRQTGKITVPKAVKPRTSRVFRTDLRVKDPVRFKKLSVPNPGRVVDGRVQRTRKYAPGSVQYRQAQRFSRSAMGELSRQVKKEERRQNRLSNKPIRLVLNRRTGKVTRVVGQKAIARYEANRTRQFLAKREARQRAKKDDLGNLLVGSGREFGKAAAYISARGQSLNPFEATAKIAGGEVAKKIAGKEKAKNIKASGLPGLPNALSKEIKVEKPENVLRLVEQTQRPIRAIASAEKQLVRNVKSGRTVTAGVGRQAVRGFGLKNNTYSSDVLKEIGIGGTAAAIAGFGLDVLQDPLTYVTFGAGAAARTGVLQAAKAAERRVYKKAYAQLTKAGMAKEAAARRAKAFGVRARRRVEEEGASRQKTYDREYHRVRRAARKRGASSDEAHAEAHKAGERAANKLGHFRFEVGTKRRKVGATIYRKGRKEEVPVEQAGRVDKARRVGRVLASEVRPTRTASRRTPKQAWAAGLDVGRRIRARTNEGVGAGQMVAEAYAKMVRPEHYDDFIDALETKNKSALPKYLTEPSVDAPVQRSSTTAYREAFKAARAGGASRAQATRVADAAARKAPQESRKVSIYDATRAALRYERKQRIRAGLVVGEIRDYFPHMIDKALRTKRPDIVKAEGESEEAARFVAGKAPRRAPAVGSAMPRTIEGTRREANDVLRAANKDEFTADVPLALGNYKLQTSRALSQAEFNKGIGRIGREVRVRAEEKPKVKVDSEGNQVEAGTSIRRSVDKADVQRESSEKVYVQVVERRNVGDGSQVRKGPAQVMVREAKPDELRQIDAGIVPRQVRRVFVADQESVKRAEAAFNQYSVVPQKFAEALANKDRLGTLVYGFVDRVYDPIHRGWKSLAVRTPQFHLRNMIGDVSMAYNQIPGHLLLPRMRDAFRITHYLRGARGSFMGFTERDKNLWIGNKVHGEMVTMEDFANEMIENGVILGGVLGNDLESISKFGARGIVQKNGRTRQLGRSFDRTLQDRENLMRIAVYKHYRDEGYDPDGAARKVADALIDYGELTGTEKEVFKRLAPFYVFAARSIPMYAMVMLTRPGKLANLEKLRQEMGKAQGLDASSLENEQAFMQRGFAFPLRWKGQTYFPTAGLPLFALNMLPAGFTGGDFKKLLDENLRYWASTLGPIPGSALETVANKTFFYDKDLEPSYRGKRVPAALPEFVGPLGKVPVVNDFLDIGPYFDKKSGKMVTGWRGRAENVFGKFTPGALGFAINLGREETARGQKRTERIASWFTGVKFDKSNPQRRRDEIAWKKWNKLKDEVNSVSQEGDSPKVKARKKMLGSQITDIEKYLYRSSKAQGYKKPHFANRAPKDPFALPELPELPKLPTLGQ